MKKLHHHRITKNKQYYSSNLFISYKGSHACLQVSFVALKFSSGQYKRQFFNLENNSPKFNCF